VTVLIACPDHGPNILENPGNIGSFVNSARGGLDDPQGIDLSKLLQRLPNEMPEFGFGIVESAGLPRLAGSARSSTMSPNRRSRTPPTGHRSTWPATAHFVADPEDSWCRCPRRKAQRPSPRETVRDRLCPMVNVQVGKAMSEETRKLPLAGGTIRFNSGTTIEGLGGDGLVRVRRPLPGRLRSAHLPAQLDTRAVST
jgi:hypothetical protein